MMVVGRLESNYRQMILVLFANLTVHSAYSVDDNGAMAMYWKNDKVGENAEPRIELPTHRQTPKFVPLMHTIPHHRPHRVFTDIFPTTFDVKTQKQRGDAR
jgi:hypothetical protein